MIEIENKESTRTRGNYAENQAIDYLSAKGLRLIIRNFNTKFGEIDLIMWDQKILVFVEVRSKSTTSYGLPEESITKTKQRKIIKTAQWYLTKHNHDGECRFDALFLNHDTKITWVKDAFQAY